MKIQKTELATKLNQIKGVVPKSMKCRHLQQMKASRWSINF